MNVSYDTYEPFAVELRVVVQRNTPTEMQRDGKTYVRPELVVRANIRREQISEVGRRVLVVAGFCDEFDRLYEARIWCGEHWEGGPDEASKAAEKLMDRISELCGELNVPYRGGEWKPT